MAKLDFITELDEIKIYYPFLKYKSTRSHLGNPEHRLYILYLLIFADVIILPPSHLLQDLKINLIKLKEDIFYRKLIINGTLITTTIFDDITSFKELLEKEAHLKNLNIKTKLKNAPNLRMFFRDERKQRKSYSLYLINKVKNIKIEKSIKTSLIQKLKEFPRHEEFLNSLRSLKSEYNTNFYKDILSYTQVAYHLGGLKGNDAIIPVREKKYIFEPAYNPLYSVNIIEKFGEHFSLNLNNSVYSIDNLLNKPERIRDIQKILYPFRYNYFKLSQEFLKFKESLFFIIEQYISENLEDSLYIKTKKIAENIYKTIIFEIWNVIKNTIIQSLNLDKFLLNFFKNLLNSFPDLIMQIEKMKKEILKYLFKNLYLPLYFKRELNYLIDEFQNKILEMEFHN